MTTPSPASKPNTNSALCPGRCGTCNRQCSPRLCALTSVHLTGLTSGIIYGCGYPVTLCGAGGTNFLISGRHGPRSCHWNTRLIRMAGINGDVGWDNWDWLPSNPSLSSPPAACHLADVRMKGKAMREHRTSPKSEN